MLKKTEIAKYPLHQVLKKAGELLAQSEYLVDRLDIVQPRDYLDIRMTGDWNSEFGTAVIKVIFVCNKKQAKDLKYLLDDEDKADDLDSGAGEAFEAAIAEVYPKKKWNYCVGKTEWAVELSNK